MFEIYAECKSAIINKKCSECNEFYSCYICDFVEERYQQGRADAIEECKKIVMAECTTTCDYPFSPNCVECMSNKMEQLKEQNENIQG